MGPEPGKFTTQLSSHKGIWGLDFLSYKLFREESVECFLALWKMMAQPGLKYNKNIIWSSDCLYFSPHQTSF